MGWVRKYLADGDAVHGVIAARKVDEKLMAARDAHDTKVHLIEFEMKVSAKAVSRLVEFFCSGGNVGKAIRGISHNQ